MINNCYRIKNYRENRNTNRLVINIDKINFLKSRKVKRNLSTKQLGLNSNFSIYIYMKV